MIGGGLVSFSARISAKFGPILGLSWRGIFYVGVFYNSGKLWLCEVSLNKCILMKEKYDIITNDYLLYHFDYSGFTSDDRKKSQNAFRTALNTVAMLQPDKRKNTDTFVQRQKAHALVVTKNQAVASAGEVGFFIAVKNALIKLMQTASDCRRKICNSQLNLKIDQMVNHSVLAEKPINLYEELGLERLELSLLSEDFLDSVGQMPEKRLAMKVLERLLKCKIKVMTKINLF
jgi:type I restriction enzyme R subunit